MRGSHGSVPPRSSGWVRFEVAHAKALTGAPQPTRYRVAVLTSWHRRMCDGPSVSGPRKATDFQTSESMCLEPLRSK
jgi:hypothetical protein